MSSLFVRNPSIRAIAEAANHGALLSNRLNGTRKFLARAALLFFSPGTSISPRRPYGMTSRSDGLSAGVMSVVLGEEESAKNARS